MKRSNRRTSSRSSRRTSSTRSTTSSWTVIEAKLGSSWSLEKSQRNGRIEEVSEFHLPTLLQDEDSSRIRTLFWNLLVRYRNCKMKKIVWMIQEIFKMLNQYAVDIPTLPVNQCQCSAVLLECRAVEKDRQAFEIRMLYRETFLQVQLRPLQHFVRRIWIHGVPEEENRFTHQWLRRVRNKHQFKIRDVSLDRQPKVLSSLVRENSQWMI